MVWGNAHELVEARNAATPFASSLEQGYPMYVMPFSELMALDAWQPHQNLKSAGKVVEFNESMLGKIFFVSHQWTSYNHPDPKMDQLKALQHILRKLADGEMSVKGNFFVEFMYGLKQGHTAAEWKTLLPEAYFWFDYTSMPQPLAALPAESDGLAAPHAGQVSDHRAAEGISEDVALLVEQLKAAVDAIPSYIERCAEMMVLTPSVKHADRTGEACDFSTWRQRGWCRLEFVSSRLCCRGDIPVMVITSRETAPQYFNMCDTMKLFAGNGTFTVGDDKYKVKGVLEAMLHAKSTTEFGRGNWGLARAHVMIAAAFLAGLPTEAEMAAHENREPVVSSLSELEQIKHDLQWRDEATEAEWLRATGVSLLHVAAYSGKVEAAKELLSTPEGQAMLSLKIKDPMKLDADVKQYKFQGSAKNVQMTTKGLTPLAAAMTSPSAPPEMIELLLDAPGASKTDYTAFLLGVMNGTLANLEAYTNKLWTAEAKAAAAKAQRSTSPAPPWLNKHFFEAMGGTPLHTVAFMSDRKDQREKMQWLLEHGADPKKTWGMGGSPLVALSLNEEADPSCFDVLVAAGCDVNEIARPWRMMKTAASLVKLFHFFRPKKFSNASEFTQMASGGSLMHFAAASGSLANMRKLAAIGAAADRKNRYGQLPQTIIAMKTPDSHAPELLGWGQLRAAQKAKAALLAGGTDKVLPNTYPAATATAA